MTKTRTDLFSLTVLAVLALLTLGSSRAHAATFTVTNVNDSGAGSLRQAVLDANATPAPDIIVFHPAFIPLPATITLTSGRLSITRDLIIQGPGRSLLKVRGDDSDSVFGISSLSSVGVIMSGMTITGKVSGDHVVGGGIVNGPEGDLTLNACTLSDCSAEDFGGAIYNQGNLTLNDCTLSGCSAGGFGGGIYNAGSVTLINSIVSGCTAEIGGAGIINVQGTLSLTDCTFSNNSATNEDFARGGGAIDTEAGTVTAERCTFSDNSVQGSGGALFLTTESIVTLNSCTLSGNTAEGFGGGAIINAGTLGMNACTLSGNIAAVAGGGIDNSGTGTLTLINTTLSGNSVTDDVLGEGGGIINDGNVRMSLCTLTGNGAPRAGGGILNAGNLNLANSTLSGNSTDHGGGGVANIGSLTVTDSTLSGNNAGTGGGLASDSGSVTLTHCTFFANFGLDGGGGIEIVAGIVTARTCTIVGNGTGGSGGGILNSGDLTVASCTVNGNIASEGGGILNQPPDIIEGPAPAGSPGNVVLENSTLSNNSAFSGGGLVNRGVAQVTNCTLTGNPAETGEGGALRNSGIMESGNTVLAHSGPGLNCLNEGLLNSNGHNLDSDGSCALSGTGDQAGTTDVPLDPKLGPLENNGGPTKTHALLSGSPAIDAGDNALSPAETDQRGFQRIADGNSDGTAVIDIGAFELSFFGGFGSRSGFGFLNYSTVQDATTTLPAGTTEFDLILHYSDDIAPATFVAKLNGVDISYLFDPSTPEGFQTVTLPLRAGPNRLVLQVKGTKNGKTVEEVDNLSFLVGEPAFGPR